jgi:hypothetical protein
MHCLTHSHPPNRTICCLCAHAAERVQGGEGGGGKKRRKLGCEETGRGDEEIYTKTFRKRRTRGLKRSEKKFYYSRKSVRRNKLREILTAGHFRERLSEVHVDVFTQWRS